MTQIGKEARVGAPVTYPFGIRNFYVADLEGSLLEIGSTGEP